MNTRPVLIVLTSLVAEGCPQLALQLARYWLRQGVVVRILCLRDQPTDLRPEFTALGCAIDCLDLGAGWTRYPRLAWLTYRLCRRYRPRAILSFPLGWHAFIALGARAAGVRRICAHVGNLPPVWTGTAFAKFKLEVQLGRPFTHRLLCCSDYIRAATIRDFGLSPRETCSIHNACDLERFLTIAHQPRPHTPPRLGMVARLERHKDQPTLISAVAHLRDRGIPVELWLIGDGSHRPQLETLIQSLRLEGQVRLLGSRRDIPELLGSLDVFVFSALPDEGFGIALAEAMAAGVPILASDVGACRELLDAGRCGLLVEPGSPAALAAAIQQLLANPAAAQARATAARERASRQFSVAAMADAYAEQLGLGFTAQPLPHRAR